MSQDPDSLYHTKQALHQVKEAIDNVSVPLFAMRHVRGEDMENLDFVVQHTMLLQVEDDLNRVANTLRDLVKRFSA